MAGSAAPASAAVYIHWHPPLRLESARNGGLSASACALTGELCVAVDTSGYAMTSTNPTGSTNVWSRPFRIDAVSGGALTGISCPATNLCVAVDAVGDVVTSTNPTGGAKAWSKPVRIDFATLGTGVYAGLAAVSCPTTKLCVAVDAANPGNVLTTINPTGGAAAWTMIKKVGAVLNSVSCASSSFCVAAGTNTYVSTNPASPAASWRATGVQAGGGTFSGIACPSLSLCAAVGFGNTSTGLATTSTTPRGGAASWTSVTIQPDPPSAGAGLFDGIGCLSSSYCVALDSVDNVFVSSNPPSGLWSAQTQIEPLSSTPPINSAIGCAPTVCVVVDSNGYAITGGKRA
ncbi:MAG: hypothetical protein ACLP0J_07810 [Solirubrobacteraceae bacterium]|jgi:hypothetical protein